MKYIYLLIFTLGAVVWAFAQEHVNIQKFTVKENLLQNGKIAIIALDSLGQPREDLDGTFQFAFNGFKQALKFSGGVAVCPLEIDKSAFIYIKHEGVEKDVSNLYYMVKSDDSLNPIKINPYWLLAIPLGLILIGYLFRKLIGLIVFFLLIFIYFNYSKGLSLPTFLESIFDSLAGLMT